MAGCAISSLLKQTTTPAYQPANVYRAETSFPPAIKRVAVLPLTTLTDEAAMSFGRDTLAPILLQELGRARMCELVPVSSDELRRLTGRDSWSGEEKLPWDLFDKLRTRLGVDAVMFSRLTQYRAYEPLAIGWRLKLFDAEEPHILWAVDEVFDARVPEVAAAAKRHARTHPEAAPSPDNTHSVLQSPRRFGHYTASAVVETLPRREPPTNAEASREQ
jgi:hypothetical protein